MDWGYNQITERIYLGGAFDSQDDATALHNLGVTRVVNCREVQDPSFVLSEFNVAWPQPAAPDNGQPRGDQWWRGVANAWRPYAMDRKEIFYFHCQAGFNRSASAVYFCLLLFGLKHIDARWMIDRHRPMDIFGTSYADEVEDVINRHVI